GDWPRAIGDSPAVSYAGWTVVSWFGNTCACRTPTAAQTTERLVARDRAVHEDVCAVVGIPDGSATPRAAVAAVTASATNSSAAGPARGAADRVAGESAIVQGHGTLQIKDCASGTHAAITTVAAAVPITARAGIRTVATRAGGGAVPGECAICGGYQAAVVE